MRTLLEKSYLRKAPMRSTISPAYALYFQLFLKILKKWFGHRRRLKENDSYCKTHTWNNNLLFFLNLPFLHFCFSFAWMNTNKEGIWEKNSEIYMKWSLHEVKPTSFEDEFFYKFPVRFFFTKSLLSKTFRNIVFTNCIWTFFLIYTVKEQF